MALHPRKDKDMDLEVKGDSYMNVHKAAINYYFHYQWICQSFCWLNKQNKQLPHEFPEPKVMSSIYTFFLSKTQRYSFYNVIKQSNVANSHIWEAGNNPNPKRMWACLWVNMCVSAAAIKTAFKAFVSLPYNVSSYQRNNTNERQRKRPQDQLF